MRKQMSKPQHMSPSSAIELADDKRRLRQQASSALAGMSPEEREALSEEACAILAAQPLWNEVRSVLFYAPLAGELNIWPLLSRALGAGKCVALPRFDGLTGGYLPAIITDVERQLTSGRFGIREAVETCPLMVLNRLDFVLVPGVAFDVQGRRLGRGKGFYDRLLSGTRAVKCGVAFEQQIVARVPVDSHDINVNYVLTPTRWVACEPRAGLQ